jgi:hypothetical protein
VSFDKPTRNALGKMVGACRRLLTQDARDQLQQIYGLQPEGTALPLDRLGHLDERGRETAAALREWLEHLAASEIGAEAKRRTVAFERMAHEIAFTLLNRLAALRMAEERGLIIECVRRGMESDGFAMYERLSGGLLGVRGQTYKAFLEHLFDELAVDLGPLFDRRHPHSLILPGDNCLERVLAHLNDKDLIILWKEDEIIGWIYQFFNSKEERDAMRKAAAAPRNSRELAVRNQFFTPRYVVQFLTDNTLGRLWYEMTRGETRLKEGCRYLVRGPKEVFLGPGDGSSSAPRNQTDVSQEGLLKQPLHIVHRPAKDPRTIRLLDPACGSMHFGIYAFDLFLVIYEEAWALEERQGPSALVRGAGLLPLRQCYDSRDAFLRDVPRLILAYNLYGIDIDPRATQIAALALWMRAQRAFQRLGLKAAERPPIVKTNLVCAEPMPGEEDLRREFTGKLQPRLLGQLVDVIVEKMTLAGEAGSLLRIEEEIKDVVTRAKQQWQAGPKAEQLVLFPEGKRSKAEQLGLFDVSGISDEAFWETAEGQILAALHRYAAQAENGKGYRRRLFAEDAEHSFAFVDVCRTRFDVVLMNPPFGEASKASKQYIEHAFPRTKNDVYAAFVERGLGWLHPRGLLGAITSRTGFFLSSFQKWREEILLKEARPVVMADLGQGVLDSAMVETAAYCLEAGP